MNVEKTFKFQRSFILKFYGVNLIIQYTNGVNTYIYEGIFKREV